MTRSLTRLKWLIIAAIVLVGAVAFAVPQATWAQNPTGDEIMQQVESRFQGNDFAAQVTLTTTNSQGDSRQIVIDLKALLYDQEHTKYKVVLKALKPADSAGLAFLAWEQVYPKNDLEWLYLPAIGQVKTIDPENERGALFGSVFNYQDVTGRPAAADTHKLTGSDTVDGRDVWVVESTPKDPSSVEFGKRIAWVDKQSLLVLKEELYDHQGNLLRTGHLVKQEKIDGIWTMIQAEVTNVQTGESSTFLFSDVKHDQGLDPSLFDPANLGS